MADTPIPQDQFSRSLRSLQDNPGAIRSESTIHSRDFYGNSETWVIETYRSEDGRETIFVQRHSAEGGTRFMLPPEVTAAMVRHRDQIISRVRRRAAHKGLATRRLTGKPIGNPEALRAARAKRAKGKK